MQDDLYGVLEIDRDASPKEIKRAYYRLVRQHPPEQDSERFQIIRNAYETLYNPKTRRDYDSMEEHGDEISRFFEQAQVEMGEENWSDAVRLFRRILVLAPGADAALNMLGMCYMHLDRYDEAIETFENLTERTPDVASFWANLGVAYLEKGDRGEDRISSPLARKAIGGFEKALEIEPMNAHHYLGISEVYLRQQEFSVALEWAEKAVKANDSVDMQDFEALFKIAMLHLFMHSFDKIEATAKRIIRILPDDEEIREYVAARFFVVGYRLAEASAFAAASAFLKSATKVDPDEEDFKQVAESVSLIADALHELEEMQDDSRILDSIKAVSWLTAMSIVEEDVEDEDLITSNVSRSIERANSEDLRRCIDRVRTEYPATYKLNEEVFSRSILINEMTDSSSCFVVTAAFGSPASPIVQKYRRFRNAYLVRSRLGRLTIRVYYSVGPRLADLIRDRPFLRRIARSLLRLVARGL